MVESRVFAWISIYMPASFSQGPGGLVCQDVTAVFEVDHSTSRVVDT